MAHINSRLERRRAKMLNLANKTVKGAVNRGRRRAQKVAKRNYHQWARRREDRTYRHLRDFHCSGDAECDCPGCSCEVWTAGRIRTEWHWDWYWESLDDLGGALRSAEKWARRHGSSDAFLSWLKRNYPDTVAGRHAIDHIMKDLHRLVGCVCNVDFSGKGNHGQCTCGAFLVDADLRGKALTQAHLDGANLQDAYLTGAKLPGVNLTGASLSRAKFADADLTGAFFDGADLRYVCLSGTDLTGADLTGADLTGAGLRGADLTGADLTGAYLEGAEANRYTRWSKGFDPEAAGVIIE